MEIIIILVVSFIVGIICFFIGKQVNNKPIEDKNNEIRQENEKLLKEQKQIQEEKFKWLEAEKEAKLQLEKSKQSRRQELDRLDSQINSKWDEFHRAEDRTKWEKQKAEQIQQQYNEQLKVIENTEQLAKKAYLEQVGNLEKEFVKDKEKYEQSKNNMLLEIDSIKQELESIKKTKIATIEAARKEKIIQENKDEYCLILPKEEERDIPILREVQYKVSKPRAVAMCIWSNYYLPIAKEKLPKILGKQDVCGIYKITNLKTEECYIGQARDVKKRIYEHMRAGLGVDTPQGNQLYAAMKEYGLENFSIELLEGCKPEELNSKEKYYIELYQSNIVGYNISGGNNG